ncbi:MAG: IS110 family transposase [Anaerolineae bacterium]|jgi:transposase
MNYLGLDVHSKATVWCLLGEGGEIKERGKIATTAVELEALVKRLSQDEPLRVGQEVGKLSHFVHDVLSSTGVELLSFNAHHLKMIASSRKKTDRRDAYWIAKVLQSGIMPHPVYITTGPVRQLRTMLSTRAALVSERTRWLVRAKTALLSAGVKAMPTQGSQRWVELALRSSDGLDEALAQRLELCQSMQQQLSVELKRLDTSLHQVAQSTEAVRRLQTIPAVGERVALTVYAWIGDVTRFATARALCAYAGLVPSVHQSGEAQRHGGITREGSKQLRAILVQAGHVLLWRCQSHEAAPLKALAERVHTARGRRKVAVVAAARFILRTAYYVLRDAANYDPTRLTRQLTEPPAQPATA